MSKNLPAFACILVGLIATTASGYSPEDSWKHEWPQTDFDNRSIELTEILSGGPPKDGIPSIDDPQFVPVSDIDDLADVEPVISLRVGNEARAYPLRILMWHEIVNDEIAGVPLVVTFCPLCNTGIVFQRVVNGTELEFGVTGKLRNSDLVMYDRQTESWWQQFTGRAIVGELNGLRLAKWPSRLESFARFRERYPDGLVQIPNDPSARDYGVNPYSGYDSRSAPYGFFKGELPGEIAPLARVVRVGERAWSLDFIRENGRLVVDDLVITWEPGQASALDDRRIEFGFDVGNVTVQRETEDGMIDVPYAVDFAFAFHAFFPDAEIVVAP